MTRGWRRHSRAGAVIPAQASSFPRRRRHSSFPRRRESSANGQWNVFWSRNWIPACAGMTRRGLMRVLNRLVRSKCHARHSRSHPAANAAGSPGAMDSRLRGNDETWVDFHPRRAGTVRCRVDAGSIRRRRHV